MAESVEPAQAAPPPNPPPDGTPEDPGLASDVAHSIVNVRVVDEPGPWRTMNVHVLDGALPGGGGSVAGLPFDFKAYRGTVSLPSSVASALADVTIDQDVTWVAQWGKLVDLTFRFEAPTVPAGVARAVAPMTVWALITGIGITMSGYRQPLPMMYGPIGGNEEVNASLVPFEIAMIDPDDFTQGYALRNIIGFPLSGEKPQFVKGNEQLITRTYFRGGQLTFDADDFT